MFSAAAITRKTEGVNVVHQLCRQRFHRNVTEAFSSGVTILVAYQLYRDCLLDIFR
jgi:hypothetical protein